MNFDSHLFIDFTREITILSKLHHPNIVQFLGATPPPSMYLITEYMEAGSLRNILKTPKYTNQLSFKLCLRIANDIALATNYLHHSNIMHRDLKPENVLIGSELGFKPVKLCDFGLSRIKDLARKEQLTKCVGTPAYIAPEVFDREDYSFKADVYSFGIIIWELFTLQSPYEDCNQYQILLKVGRGERPIIPFYFNKLLGNLIEECWHQGFIFLWILLNQIEPDHRPDFSVVLEKLEIISTINPSSEMCIAQSLETYIN